MVSPENSFSTSCGSIAPKNTAPAIGAAPKPAMAPRAPHRTAHRKQTAKPTPISQYKRDPPRQESDRYLGSKRQGANSSLSRGAPMRASIRHVSTVVPLPEMHFAAPGTGAAGSRTELLVRCSAAKEPVVGSTIADTIANNAAVAAIKETFTCPSRATNTHRIVEGAKDTLNFKKTDLRSPCLASQKSRCPAHKYRLVTIEMLD
jgi:hypothetical protein